MPLIRKVIAEAAGMGFSGGLCLNFFNEPLLDTRLAEIALYAKENGHFKEVYANTNGDRLNTYLDGTIDRLVVALYDKSSLRREARIAAMFRKTRLTFTRGGHVVTHYSPFANLDAAIEECCNLPCIREAQQRMIISSTGDMHLCCEDIAGEWNLGNIRDHTLEELWFGGKHMDILGAISKPGGRNQFPYCQICPRP
jgi:MoaA/NifB/PqqE/SkfB family radical SAM enzyme